MSGRWARWSAAPDATAPAWAITAVLGVAYLILAPGSADLAAATYRSDLFGRAGFTLWDNAWYGGHHIPAYSLLAPALGWVVGPRLLAVISMTIAAILFAELIDGRFPPRATRVAAAWFAFGAGIGLLSSRVAFDLGLALGLGAMLAAQRGRRAVALVLAVLCASASPVAGAFLALAALAWAVAARPPIGSAALRRLGLAAAALAPVAMLAVLFPEGGSQPFDASSALPALAGVLILAALIPSRERALRAGALIYALALAGAFLLTTPVGGNADRLGALLAGPLAACVLAGRYRIGGRPLALLVLAPFLAYWQVNSSVSDFASAVSDPSVHASYYAPLLRELSAIGATDPAHPMRIEVVATANHWEAALVAPHVAIARGWERQLDRKRDALFYEGSRLLDAGRYHGWLLEDAVSYVALPDATLDYSGVAEGRLLEGAYVGAGAGGAGRAPAYLHEVWRSAHWRLFAVGDARPLAQPPARLTALGGDSFTLRVPAAGSYVVRVRFTPYWKLASGHGCVVHAAGDWTQVQARGAGSFRAVIAFSPARIFAHGPRCR